MDGVDDFLCISAPLHPAADGPCAQDDARDIEVRTSNGDSLHVILLLWLFTRLIAVHLILQRQLKAYGQKVKYGLPGIYRAFIPARHEARPAPDFKD
jgi:hypothetical protein